MGSSRENRSKGFVDQIFGRYIKRLTFRYYIKRFVFQGDEISHENLGSESLNTQLARTLGSFPVYNKSNSKPNLRPK